MRNYIALSLRESGLSPLQGELGPLIGPLAVVIDDEPAVLRFMALILRELNYRVLVAVDAETALTLISAADSPPDLMLIDVRLPSMSGVDLTSRLKADPRFQGTAIILTSAYPEPYGHKADAFLPKPFDADDLVRVTRGLRKLADNVPRKGNGRGTVFMRRLPCGLDDG